MGKDKDLHAEGFQAEEALLTQFIHKIEHATTVNKLLTDEMALTKTLYRIAATTTKTNKFSRNREANDDANAFLNHGNYLAYGLAATTLWVLGIPHGHLSALKKVQQNKSFANNAYRTSPNTKP